MYVCIYVYMYVCMYVCIHVYVCMYVFCIYECDAECQRACWGDHRAKCHANRKVYSIYIYIYIYIFSSYESWGRLPKGVLGGTQNEVHGETDGVSILSILYLCTAALSAKGRAGRHKNGGQKGSQQRENMRGLLGFGRVSTAHVIRVICS